MFLPCRPCCCLPCGDCTCSVQFRISWPGYFSEAGYAFSDNLLYFTLGPTDSGAYITGTVTLSCECGVWYITADLCYGTGEPGDFGTTEIWRAAVPADPENGYCAEDDDDLDFELVDEGSSPLVLTGTVSCL